MRCSLLVLVALVACGKVKGGPECATNTDCTDPALGVCGPDGTCVGCVAASDCSGATPVCDTGEQACRACAADAECTGGVCIEAEGACVADADVAFVADLGDDSGDCTRAAPCGAIGVAAAKPHRVVHVLGGTLRPAATVTIINGDHVLDGEDTALELGGQPTLEIFGPAKVVVEGFRIAVPPVGTTPVVALRVQDPGAVAVLHDVEFAGEGGIAVFVDSSAEATIRASHIGTLTSQNPTEIDCRNAKLHLDRNVLETAFATTPMGECEATVTRNRFESSRDRSVLWSGGLLVMENNLIIHRDGFNDSISFAALRSGSTVRFNTVVNTTALASDGAALSCDGSAEVTSNIFAYNSGHPITGTNCVTRFSIFDDVATTSAGTGNQVTGIDTIFANRGAGDYHLAPASIARGAAEPGLIMVKEDFDGNPRPAPAGSTADSGAFEAP